MHVKASHDGINYDTEDLFPSSSGLGEKREQFVHSPHPIRGIDIPFAPGQMVRKTVELNAKVMFVKVILENLDLSHDITDVKVTATLGNS